MVLKRLIYNGLAENGIEMVNLLLFSQKWCWKGQFTVV